MSEELHRKLRDFLVGEVNRREERQCVRIELLYAPKGARPTPLKDWTRPEYPEIFESLTLVEKLTTTIIESAMQYADSFMSGKHRFEVITKQHLGGHVTFAFVMQASMITGEGDETSLAAPGTVGPAPLTEGTAAHVIATLTRAQQSMFDGTVRVLGATNAQFREENNELRARVRELERELDAARSDRLEREFMVQVQGAKESQRGEILSRLMQFASIAAGQYVAGDPKAPGAPQKTEAALKMMMSQLAHSLTNEQISAIFNGAPVVFDQGQRALLMQIMTVATREDAPQQAGASPPNGANGAHSPA